MTHGNKTAMTFAATSMISPTFAQYPAKFSPLMSKAKYSFAEAVKPSQSSGKRISHCSTPEYSVTVGVKE